MPFIRGVASMAQDKKGARLAPQSDRSVEDLFRAGDLHNALVRPGPTAAPLTTGSIAFTAFQADNTGGAGGDYFQFILLEAVSAGTTIYFTDNGYRTDLSAFRTNEQVLRWVAQANLAAGTLVSFTATGGVGVPNSPEWSGINANTGGVASNAQFQLAGGGDNMFAIISPIFGGSDAIAGTAIAALTFGGATFASTWSGSSGMAHTALPPGLTDGLNAVSIAPTDNGRYVGPTSGTAAALLAAINTDANWTTSTNPLSPAGAGPFTIAPPNQPPVVDLNGPGAGTGYASSWSEEGAGARIGDPGMTISDDQNMIASVTLAIADGREGDQIYVESGAPGWIGSAWDPVGYSFTLSALSGTRTAAEWAQAVSYLRYASGSQNPDADGTRLSRTISVTANDGMLASAPATATITIVPQNDPAQFGQDLTGEVTEDASDGAGGHVSVFDVDGPESFVPMTNVATAYGTFSIDSAGNWVYTLDQGHADPLRGGADAQDVIRIAATDGTPQDIVITIHGANDAAMIGGTDTGSVTEDDVTPASGTLMIHDVDEGESSFQAQSLAATAHGTFSIVAGGAWSYQLDNSHPDVQALNQGQSLTDTIEVRALDGTPHDIVIQIHGADEPIVVPPGLDLDGGESGNGHSGSYIEGQAGAAIGVSIAVTQGTLPITGATITIADPLEGDALILGGALPATIAASFDAMGTRLTLIGIGPAADWAAALAAVRYRSASDNPDSYGIDAERAINVTVTNGVQTSAPASATLAIIPVNDDPAIGGFNGDSASWTEGDSYALLDQSLPATLADPDNLDFAGGSLSIGVQIIPRAEDEFFVLDTFPGVGRIGNDVYVDGDHIGTITASGPGAILTIAFNMAATAERVATLIGYIGYRNHGGDNPTPGSRSVSYLLSDGAGGTATGVVTLDVGGIDDPLVVEAATGPIAYVEGDLPLRVGPGLTIADPDGPATLEGATVTISSGHVAGEDELAWDPALAASFGLSAHFAGGVLTFSGTASLADYQALLRSVAYSNGGGDAPTGGDRVIEFAPLFVPAVGNAAVVMRVEAANDAPALAEAIPDRHGAEDIAFSYEISADAFFDPDGDELTYEVTLANGDPLPDWLDFDSDSRILSGQPPLDFHGRLSLRVIASDGALDAHDDFDLVIDPVNDAARISGDAAGEVIEAGGLDNGTLGDAIESGNLDAADADNDPDAWQAVAGGTASAGGFGTYGLSVAGIWSYRLDDDHPEVQALNGAATLTDRFTLFTQDGTAQVVTILIRAQNDAAMVIGSAAGTVTEAGGTNDGIPGDPAAGGDLDAADPDNMATFQATSGASASGYGTYGVDQDGGWSYTLDNGHAAVQALAAGATLGDSFTILTADGTAQIVAIVILGANDSAAIDGDGTGEVAEAGAVNGGTVVATGDLDARDVDDPDDAWQAVAGGTASANGYGTYALTGAGLWSYTLDNGNAAVQGLNGAATLIDTFTALTADGTAQLVTITIHAQNDAAVISGDKAGEVTEAGGADNGMPGSASAIGDLDSTDVDNAGDAWQAALAGTASDEGYGTYTLTASGVWTYTLDDNHAAVQALAGAATLTDTFTVLSADGTAQVVTITITGANDAATITGDTTGDVVEAGGVGNNVPGTPTDTGDLNATDPDSAATFQAASGASTGGLGTYSVDANGSWSYTLDNNNATVQALAAAATTTDTFTVLSADGTPQVVTITITGANDAATITGDNVGAVTEDGPLTDTGMLTISDPDTGQAELTPIPAGTAGANGYGTFEVLANGQWIYTLDNTDPAVQALIAGGTLQDTILVTSEDGTDTETITITITGVNDSATIGGDNVGAVTEDGPLTDTGTLTIGDADTGQAELVPIPAGTAGANSYGTFEVLANGQWTYTLDNTDPVVQALAAGATLQDTILVTSEDGTDTETITVTITGVNDAPVLADVNVTLADQSEDDPAPVGAVGTLVSSLVDLASVPGGRDNVTDLDSPSIGIAVTGADTANGSWLYSIDGGASWQALGAVSGSSARLLGPNDRLYFQPNAGFDGTIANAITFRAWDMSAGTAGTLADTTSNGGTTPYSAATDTASLTVTPDNVPPVVDLNSGDGAANVDASVSYTEDAPGIAIGPAILVSDPNEGTGDLIESATIILTDAEAGDSLVLTASLPGGFSSTVTSGAGTLTLTINGAGSSATYQALIASIRFATSQQNPIDLTRMITVTVFDGLANSAVATSTVTIVPQDDAPVAQPDAYTTNEATVRTGNVITNPSGMDSDVDGPGPLVVGAVNGSTSNVGQTITLASGATLKLDANGDFSYNPAGQFNHLPGPASGASNLSATDTFTYTLQGGNTVTVTITITGLDSDGDILIGTPGVDMLDGGIGADSMTGLGGDDTYFVDNAGDTVTEVAGEGSDTIRTSLDYALSAAQSVETLTTTNVAGIDSIDLTGNQLDNRIEGNAGVNLLIGNGGQDLLFGQGGGDMLNGGIGNDLLDGGAGIDTATFADVSLAYADTTLGWQISSSEGDDFVRNTEVLIDGAGKRNLLVGGTGFATVQAAFTAADAGDNVRLAAGSYTGTSTYSDAGLTVIAQPGAQINATFGPAGSEGIRVYGAELADTITTGAGDDLLNGGLGNDTLTGGAGNDFYFVDSGDQVVEVAGQGSDRIFATGDYALQEGLSVETLSTADDAGTQPVRLIGNSLDNTLLGNAGDNFLRGGAGADLLAGRGGNDFYFIESDGDVVVEQTGEGVDRVFTSVSHTLRAFSEIETLSTDADDGTGAINLTGNTFSNNVYGNAGANMLDGKEGNDFLVGRAGADTFAFTTALGSGNVDTIGDFNAADDTIALDDAVFAGLASGALDPNAFVIGTAAQDGNDRIIYDSTTGALYFDADGNGAGAQVQFATLTHAPPITAADFTVI